jgi:hypothetical protein
MKSASSLERTNNHKCEIYDEITTTGKLDEDGILLMAPKPGRYSYRFDPTVFPST